MKVHQNRFLPRSFFTKNVYFLKEKCIYWQGTCFRINNKILHNEIFLIEIS